ncbi:hypothetical protein ACM40_13325 [Chryseobacterium sp. BLS98]|uniref:hypothetical protein n=1 Tax=Chryseobacterium sp. BLS98 TaxID=885586 RepID=UPI00065ACF58|nr:hypothetical protein [Chryseobacterium sp. BLS98]KMQ60727.1 hypothetical protein ACM40_13325 [Chryseobacterium sp. BLS98]
MKKIFFTLSVIISIFCFAQKELQPAGSEILDTVEGDLDGDKIPERVVIYTTTDEGELGKIREIQIQKKSGGTWMVLSKSRNAILESAGGGMMGDPYQETTIEKGILNITQAGGSSWKWGYTDKYRFQNGRFELIGHSSTYGRPVDYWTEVDFNLSTGQLNYNKEVENTAEYGQSMQEIYIKKGLKIDLQNRNQKEPRKIILPKTKEEVYL